MENLIIYGIGTVAEDLYYYINSDSIYNIVAFTVDDDLISSEEMCGLPLMPFSRIEKSFPPSACQMIIAVGYSRLNSIREAKYRQAKGKGYSLANYISTRANLLSDTIIGDNCIVSANVSVQPRVIIGNNILIRENAFIGHNTVIEDHCFISAAATICGKVKIGRFSHIGANATIVNNINIGENCIVGAGTTMSHDTTDHQVYMNRSSQLLPLSSNKIST